MKIYDRQFRGNILVVGKTDCGKICFLQKLGLHNFFGNIVKIEWVSGTEISKTRESEMQSCFSNDVELHPAPDTHSLKSFIETFKLKTQDLAEDDVNINDYVYGEKIIMDRLIVMDDVSGIADSCKEFAGFLTVSRKYRYHCVYVFHIIILNKEIWQKIISETNIFNIFPCSVPYNTVSKILQNNCVQQTTKYVPVCSMWLNRVFIDLANTNQKNCLTND